MYRDPALNSARTLPQFGGGCAKPGKPGVAGFGVGRRVGRRLAPGESSLRAVDPGVAGLPGYSRAIRNLRPLILPSRRRASALSACARAMAT